MLLSCVKCGEVVEVDIQPEQLMEFVGSGKNPAEVFPHLTVDKLELLISGLCNKCWIEEASPSALRSGEKVEESLTDEERNELNDAAKEVWDWDKTVEGDE